MKHANVWIVVIFLGITAILVVSRLVSGVPKEPPRQEIPLVFSEAGEATSDATESAATSDETSYAFETTEEADGSTRLTGEGLTIVVPQDWLITAGVGEAPSGDSFIEDRREILLRLQNAEADEMSDPDVVYMDVERIAKDGRAYSEVVKDWTWTREDAETQARFMRENSEAPYNEITADDIVIEAAAEALGGQAVDYAYFSCTKSCYIEGGPPTWKRYFFDAKDEVYAISVRVVTGEQSEALLAEAVKVVATFEVK